MKIAILQGSSQKEKNKILFNAVQQAAPNAEVINFGVFEDEQEELSYVEASFLIGLLLNSGAVDFVVTGCSSGQGMMLACNSIPGVLCGYAPTPKDAYLFAQINNGNAVSLPLGEEYTYTGEKNLEETIKALFSEPFGGGYPKSEAKRKITDANQLKAMKASAQISFQSFMEGLDDELVKKVSGLMARTKH